MVGGGVGGLAAAAALRLAGRDALVLERSSDDAEYTGQALGLWTNGWCALEALGVDARTLRQSYANHTIEIQRARDGNKLGTIQMPEAAEFRYVMRGDLLAALRATLPASAIRHDAEVTRITRRGTGVDVTMADGTVLGAAGCVGADGVLSAVRETLGINIAPRMVGYRAWRGSARVKDGELLALPVGQVLQVWGEGERLGATRVRDDIVHWFYTGSKDGDDGLEYVRGRVAHWECEVAKEVVGCEQLQFEVTKCGDRLQWTPGSGVQGPVTLLGDAAHMCTPNLGQGAALALEDAVELGYRVGRMRAGEGLGEAMRRYERARFMRNLVVGVRSAAVGELVNLQKTPLVWARNNIVAPLVMKPIVVLSTTWWTPPA